MKDRNDTELKVCDVVSMMLTMVEPVLGVVLKDDVSNELGIFVLDEPYFFIGMDENPNLIFFKVGTIYDDDFIEVRQALMNYVKANKRI